MEFLVTMTTRVPDGTTTAEIAGMRAREAEHSRELAAAGRLVRLWRPPLAPGEWRTYGLFEAADAEELEAVLVGMPLRIWRSDAVAPLGEHPNDPGRGAVPIDRSRPELFAELAVTVPEGTAAQVVDDCFGREARRAAELAAVGTLIRLWRREDGTNLGLWQAADAAELNAVFATLPLALWLQTSIEPLSTHPSDPARPPQPVG